MPNVRWPKKLVAWFHAHQRRMPWRDHPEPYRVWVSEVMLQQTQVDTVIPYFNRFIARFPDVCALAAADLQQVLKLWEGLGYYSRARNLHAAAKIVCDHFNAALPDTYEGLQQLPGIGPYIAAAITSIAFGRPVPVVDGNVLRVFARFWGIEEDIRDARMRTLLFDRLTPMIARCDPSAFNQAMMELGALICSPRSPQCGQCPLKAECVAHASGRTAELPFKSRKVPVPHYEIAIGVVWRAGKVLIARRREDQMLGGLWEFPGGKMRAGEPAVEAVMRELREETGLSVRPLHKYCTVRHAYTHFKITLHAYACEAASGPASAHVSDEVRWVTPAELQEYPFPTANRKVIAMIDRAPDLGIGKRGHGRAASKIQRPAEPDQAIASRRSSS